MKNPTFIEVFSNALNQSECKSVIDYFNRMRLQNLVFSRQELNDGLSHKKMDETVFLAEPDTFMLDNTHPILAVLLEKVRQCYIKYVEKYSVLADCKNHGVYSIRLQKTEIGGGYHDWHFENLGRLSSNRFLAFTVYLNSVTLGGETEYLYQNIRIPATQGSVALWPAGFTHPHRGNPPISGEKYIATGWIEYFE